MQLDSVAFAATRPKPQASPAAHSDARLFRLGWARTPGEVAEAQRLRYRVFAAEMGARMRLPAGSARGHDIDAFDPFCDHLLVRAVGTARHDEVIATCRILSPEAAQRAGGHYIDGEFDLSPLRSVLPLALEMGRVCVDPAWRNGLVVMALWQELGQQLIQRGLDTIIGCSSVSLADGGDLALRLWRDLQPAYLVPATHQVRPRNALALRPVAGDEPARVPALTCQRGTSGGFFVAEARLSSASGATVCAAARVGRLERLPKWLNLVPMIAQWLWLSMRYGSISLPSCADPAITTGGMVGEGKLEYLRIMGPRALAHVATTTSVIAKGPEWLREAERAMSEAGLKYPVVLKPDLGWCGFGVRRIDNAAQLAAYLGGFPRGERIVIQQWLNYPGEAGIFYMRDPGRGSGDVIGILLRHYPRVVGDGSSTIAQLIAADPRASRLGRDGASEAGCDLALVPAAGETVRISTVGSTRVGGLYEDASSSITVRLVHAIDAIARDMKDFHVGRFDVKFTDLRALAEGDFRIMEVNGAGSEAVHAWDPSLTLREAYGIVFAKQRRLFAIGAAMRSLGHRPVGWLTLARHHFRQQALIKRYPPSN